MIQIQLYQTEPQMYQIYGCQWDLSKPNWKKAKKAKKGQKSDWEKSRKKGLWKKTQPQLLMSLLPSDSACERKWISESILCVCFAFLNLTEFFKDLSIHLLVFLTFVKTEMLASVGFFKLNNGMALTLLTLQKNLQKNYRDSLWITCIPAKLLHENLALNKIWEKKKLQRNRQIKGMTKQHIAFGC